MKINGKSIIINKLYNLKYDTQEHYFILTNINKTPQNRDIRIFL